MKVIMIEVMREYNQTYPFNFFTFYKFSIYFIFVVGYVTQLFFKWLKILLNFFE